MTLYEARVQFLAILKRRITRLALEELVRLSEEMGLYDL